VILPDAPIAGVPTKTLSGRPAAAALAAEAAATAVAAAAMAVAVVATAVAAAATAVAAVAVAAAVAEGVATGDRGATRSLVPSAPAPCSG